MAKNIKDFDENTIAQLFIVMNHLAPGKLTTQSDITVTINQKDISIEEYIKSFLPGVDFEKATAEAFSTLKKINKK